MSDANRTHKATPKRVREFRDRGDIALSRDLVSAAALVGGTIGLVVSSGAATTSLLELARECALAMDGHETPGLVAAALHGFLVSAVPVVLGAAGAATLAIFAQLGWPPAWKSIGFDLGRISPLANLRQTFALSAMARRTGTALAKLALVGAIVVAVLLHGLAVQAFDPHALGPIAWHLVGRALLLVLIALGALGAVDYALARRRVTAKMRMSTDEAKREQREQDGDPVVRGRRKQRMKELARRRMAAAVAKADVVVVNPTHYAVALRYDEHTDRAPVVVAKGTDESAEKIREIARRHGVPILPRPPLARALHKHVKEGRAVPANLYRAVAEVLAYVYRIKRGGAA